MTYDSEDAVIKFVEPLSKHRCYNFNLSIYLTYMWFKEKNDVLWKFIFYYINILYLFIDFISLLSYKVYSRIHLHVSIFMYTFTYAFLLIPRYLGWQSSANYASLRKAGKE